MLDRSIGTALRAIRIRSQLTQRELSIAADVPRSIVQVIERGHLHRVPLGDLRAVAGALDASADLYLRWRGGDLPRLVNARHAALHEVAACRFAELPEWRYEPEVSFAHFGERGTIDGLGWHPTTRSLLIEELKSEFVDFSDLMGTVDRKRRLAAEIVRERGWQPLTVSTWVAVADGRTNRRALARHATVLRSKFPADGHRIAAWLRHPEGRIDALSFLPVALPDGRPIIGTASRLVRHAREERGEPARG
jgi:transcriptional regulator with XRE-family HTH domain